MESELELPSLCRPVQIGMPYDCRTDKLVTRSMIKSCITSNEGEEILQGHCDIKICLEDCMKTKAENLGVSGDLKVSVLCGLISVGSGSAKYIADQTSSEKQVRVTLRYSCTTHFKSIAPEQTSALDHSQLANIEATHIVTGISYGIKAFLIFDQNCSSTDEKGEILAELQASVKAIKGLAPSASLNLDRSTSSSTRRNTIVCQFYGDTTLSSIPSTYKEAVDAYKELKSFGKEKSVPQMIHLTPLHIIDKKRYEQIHIYPVTTVITMKIEAILDYVHESEIKCNDLEDLEACTVFTSVRNQISKFRQLLDCFRTQLKEKLSVLVPQVRRTGNNEELTRFFELIENSPFKEERLREFIDDKRTELSVLNQHRKNLQPSNKPKLLHAFSNQPWIVDELIHDSNYDKVFCFVFNVTSESNIYVDAMEKYMETGEPPTQDISISQWFHNEKINSALAIECKKFSQFVEDNKKSPKFAFVMCERRNGIENSGPLHICYSSGVQKVLKMPPAPTVSNISTEACAVTFSLEMSREFDCDIQQYWIHYRKSSRKKWNTECVPKQQKYTVQNFSSNTEYYIAVQALTKFGFSPRSSEYCVTTAPSEKVSLNDALLKLFRKTANPKTSQLALEYK